jgi:O-antigen/teichoic acid export membrane protein
MTERGQLSNLARVLRSPKAGLTAANLFDFGLQLLTPIFLVRLLDPQDFGLYRLFWLVVNTATSFGVPAVTRSLFYFLPRAEAAERRGYIKQVLLFLAAIGGAAAIVILFWVPMLPLARNASGSYVCLLSAFTFVWITSVAIDALPSADERIGLQARVTVAWALLRTTTLAFVALATGELHQVLIALCVLVTLRFVTLAGYVYAFYGHDRCTLRRERFARHLTYVLPFALAGALYGLRVQADPWVAAHFFGVQQFAAFSLAIMVLPLTNVLRQSITSAALPEMNRLHARGNVVDLLRVGARANLAIATLCFPAAAFLFAFAQPIVELLFTERYVAAVPVLRVYCVCFLALSIDVSGMAQVLNQGNYAMRVNLSCIAVSVLVSVIGAQVFGLAGTALGGTLAAYVELYVFLRRVSRVSDCSLRQTQSWGNLGKLLACAAAAAGVAYGLSLGIEHAAWGIWVQMTLAAAVCAATYLGLVARLRLLPGPVAL